MNFYRIPTASSALYGHQSVVNLIPARGKKEKKEWPSANFRYSLREIQYQWLSLMSWPEGSGINQFKLIPWNKFS
jgi:hypothetical protein